MLELTDQEQKALRLFRLISAPKKTLWMGDLYMKSDAGGVLYKKHVQALVQKGYLSTKHKDTICIL